jgi:hypothetical protein
VQWNHIITTITTPVTQPVIARSGNPGYDIAKPVISATLGGVNNETLMYNEYAQLRRWATGRSVRAFNSNLR